MIRGGGGGGDTTAVEEVETTTNTQPHQAYFPILEQANV